MYQSSGQEFLSNNISYNDNVINHITAYSKPCLLHEAYLKPCKISNMMRHTENPGIVKTIYTSNFKDTEGYSKILMHI